MAAEVPTKRFFSRLKAAKTIPLIAPPVPINPARNPANAPPEMLLVKVGSILALGFTKRRIDKTTRKIPSSTFA